MVVCGIKTKLLELALMYFNDQVMCIHLLFNPQCIKKIYKKAFV